MTNTLNSSVAIRRDGRLLHQMVPADRWCVTCLDLVQFRRLVKSQVVNQLIQPTERDKFDICDDQIGPCIHTVNRELIMPITEKAGGMSWALMLHTDGLKCDLFVTHCWQEGLYEFIDKVLCSWPRGACHAYCCMFSNPQNLEIGQMIGHPRQSPFAQALCSASHMLVVPNSRCSIYTRIWCCYEAYLAYSESKIILTASAPVPGLKWEVLKVLLVMVIMFLLSVLFWSVFHQWREGVVGNVADTYAAMILRLSFLCIVLASLMKPSRLSKALVYIGAILSAVDLGWFLTSMLKTIQAYGRTEVSYSTISYLWRALLPCAGVACAEADRHWRIRLEIESSQLRRGYTRRLQDAEASQSQDKEQILQELADSGVVEDVNMAINVLLTSGMSTPTLRIAACRAGTLKLAGHWNLSLAVLPWLAWLWLPFTKILRAVDQHVRVVGQGHCDKADLEHCYNASAVEQCDEAVRKCADVLLDPMVWISLVVIFQTLCWATCFVILRNDKRGFAVRVLVCALVVAAVVYACTLLLSDSETWEDSVGQIFAVIIGPIILTLSTAGPGHTSRLPVVGPWIVQVLMWHPSLNWLVRDTNLEEADCGTIRHQKTQDEDAGEFDARNLSASIHGVGSGSPIVEL